ncbi:MAG: amino acid kinase [Candidatus Thorarchaeota archaeon]|nr:MAG: amino acid kinase [Candidatus Thorarchaeota archaeon]
MGNDLTVIKLGGSLLTDKSKPYEARKAVIKSVTRELKTCVDEGLIKSLVAVQGVGSYGHPPILEHGLHKGFKGPEQLIPLSKTQRIVNEFREMVAGEFHLAGLPVNLLHPSSMVVAEKMRITKYFLDPLKGYLSLGMVPLLGGDMLYDTAMGFSVGSGDQLAVLLARELSAKRLIFAMDVAGIYTGNPKTDPKASVIKEVNLNETDKVLAQMGSSGTVDASGAIKGKLAAIAQVKDLVGAGLQVTLLSMMKQGNLLALLRGQTVACTHVVVK